MNLIPTRPVLTLLGAALALTCSAQASSRRFAYTYETTTMPKGAMELETWLTWKRGIAEEPGLDEFDMRHEFEFGVTDKLQMSVYFADWSHSDGGDAGGSETNFDDVAIETIYNLTDPNSTPFGSAVYGEIAAGKEGLELEAKLLLQKNLGPWMFAYNIGAESEWEDYDEASGELFQTLGVSYQLCPSFAVGLEALHEVGVPEWSEIGDSGVFVGPNIAWQHNCYSLSMTGLWQLTSLDDEPDFQLRTIFSYHF